MQMRVAILSSHSLFTEGVASRLREYPQQVEVLFVDPQQPDYLEKILEIHPAAIIIDAADRGVSQGCTFIDLLMSFFKVPIIRLEAHKDDIQIITSEQHNLKEVRDLIKVLEQYSQLQG